MDMIMNYIDFTDPTYIQHPYLYIGIKVVLAGMLLMVVVSMLMVVTVFVDFFIVIINVPISFFTDKRIPTFNEYSGNDNSYVSSEPSTFPQGKRTVGFERYVLQVRLDNGWNTVGHVDGDGPNAQSVMYYTKQQYGDRQVRLATAEGKVVDIM